MSAAPGRADQNEREMKIEKFSLAMSVTVVTTLTTPAIAQNSWQDSWQDITGSGRGQAQFEKDAGLCRMTPGQSAAGQPGFTQTCMLSRGWKEVAAPAQPETVQADREFHAQAGRDTQVGTYINLRPDCTPGPLPTLRLIIVPAHGTISFKQGSLMAPNFRQCPSIEVTAILAFYRAAAGYSGTDMLELETSSTDGQIQREHIRLSVSNASRTR